MSEGFRNSSIPRQEAMDGRRPWVILPDGRCGYIDHFKQDGRFGVRPVQFETGRHYPNPSIHWTDEEREAHPEELALSFHQLRPASMEQIPGMYRSN